MGLGKLVELGLTKNQAKAYLELISHPNQSAGELSKKLSIDRSFVYSILESLNDKGLVGYIVTKNRRIYHASAIENLIKEIDEKRAIALDVVKQLKSFEHVSTNAQSVVVYDGVAGLHVFIRDVLKGKEFEFLGGGGLPLTLDLLKYKYAHYIADIKNYNLSGKAIVSENNYSIVSKLFKNSRIQIKSINKKPSQVNFAITHDTVAIFSSDKPRTIIIKDEQVAAALKVYFDIIWNSI